MTATLWNGCRYPHIATAAAETELLLCLNNSLTLLMQENTNPHAHRNKCNLYRHILFFNSQIHKVTWHWGSGTSHYTHTHRAPCAPIELNGAWLLTEPFWTPHVLIALLSAATLCCAIMGWSLGCHGGISILCCSAIHIHPYQSHQLCTEVQYPSSDKHSVNFACSASWTVYF